MMTRKENILAIYRHEKHDHIGAASDFAGCGGMREEFENGPAGTAGGLDGFGMEWMRNSAGSGAGTPAPGKVVLPDVTEWKKYVRFPDVTDYDWAGMAREQLANVNRDEKVVDYGCWNGPFLRLVDLMGMVDGLMALVEEPEACEELLTAITDYRITTLEYIKKYFDPDVVTIYDDFAHERGLFISPTTYNELIAPQHRRWAEAVKSYGFIPDMHVCGKPEMLVPGFAEEGFAAWQIAAPENDLVSLQETCADRLAFIGCWDIQAKWIGPDMHPTPEDFRLKVRDTIDRYGPGGNISLMCMFVNPNVNNPFGTMKAMQEEIISYGTGYYC